MSATLPNLDMLASWLDADIYKSDCRPVPLKEYVKIGDAVYDKNFQLQRRIRPPVHIQVNTTVEFDCQRRLLYGFPKGDGDHVTYLCLEAVLEGHSTIVFCPTKKWCETLADSVSKEFFALGRNAAPATATDGEDRSGADEVRRKLQGQLDGKVIGEFLERLKRCPTGADALLTKVARFGVAYHHAGLSFYEREVVEDGFKTGSIRVLVATTTLSSGINLPARRVILRSPYSYKYEVTCAKICSYL